MTEELQTEVDFDDDFVPSITLLNRSGDVTIQWDDHNKDAVMAMVRKKMDEGYSFFAIVPRRILGIDAKKKIKLTSDNFEKTADKAVGLLITDNAVAELVKAGSARLGQPAGGDARSVSTTKRLKTPEEVVQKQSVAVKPVFGG